MNIKRFLAVDIRQAMRMVREELGGDAVIMSNRSVPEGVEIVAALDFDEHWFDNKNAPAERNNQTEPQPAQPPVNADPGPNNGKPHIIPSTRKREIDGTISKRPLRSAFDSYQGSEPKPLPKKGNNRFDDKAGIAAQSTSATPNRASNAEALMQQTLLDMRHELRSLGRTMEQKFARQNSDEQRPQQPARLDVIRRLTDLGIAKHLSAKIAKRFAVEEDIEVVWTKALKMLRRLLTVADNRLLEQGGIAVFVGPTGVGKTTTIAKLAAQYVLKHGPSQVALISTDNYRIAAHEQLNGFGRILGVTVRAAATADELTAILKSFAGKKLILIDTAGMNQRDMKLTQRINIIKQSEFAIKTYLVMSAATQAKVLDEIIDAFKVFDPIAAILTKFDEAADKGTALSALIEHDLPLSYLTDGQQVPEDLHRADATDIIYRCVAELDCENDYNRGIVETGFHDWMTVEHA